MSKNLSEILNSLQLNTVLGYSLPAKEFQECLDKVQYISPKVGKIIADTDIKSGIYIILSGKVRLLDDTDELIATLETGASFGEFSLFPEVDFFPYVARASINLHLAFIDRVVLSGLMAKYPQIHDHLRRQADISNSAFVNFDTTQPIADFSARQFERQEDISYGRDYQLQLMKKHRKK